MSRTQLSVTVEENLLKKFREYCDKNDINMSRRLERYIKNELGKRS